MAEERVPFKFTPFVRRNPDPVARGAEYGTPIPLIRGIQARVKGMRGPTEEELAQWQEQIKKMQAAGFAWDDQRKQWRRGDLYVDPWAIPDQYPRQEKKKAAPVGEEEIAAQAQSQGLEDAGNGQWQDQKGNLYWWDNQSRKFLKRL